MSTFSIQILRQGWLQGVPAEKDLCSHGRIRLEIGGQPITSGDEEFGISESALALLRTLLSDHTAAHPMAERLIPHGCGTLLMLGCGLGVDWSVLHQGETVALGNVVRYDGAGATQAALFPDINVVLNEAEYASQIVQFALEARRPFEGQIKDTSDEDVPGEFAEFWKEFDHILVKVGADLPRAKAV